MRLDPISRSRIYKRVFARSSPVSGLLARIVMRLRSKRAAYREVFRRYDADIVLADLARYGNAVRTTFVTDNERASALMEGRRQFWLYVQALLELDEKALREQIASAETKLEARR